MRMRDRKPSSKPMTFLTLTCVSESVSESATTTRTIHAPVVPSRPLSADQMPPPTMPPLRDPAAPNAASIMRKYESAEVPRVAIMRGTLISRKMIAPRSATSTGKSAAPPPNSSRSPPANARPALPACPGTARAIPHRSATDKAAIPTISRFSFLAFAFRRTRAIDYKRFVVRLGDHLQSPTIVVLDGDQTGEELLAESLRVLDESVIDIPLAFEHYDLSLENRRATSNQVVHDAAAAMRAHKLGLKAATITPEQTGDVGSPNAIL